MAKHNRRKKNRTLSFLITLILIIALIFSYFPEAKNYILDLFDEPGFSKLSEGELSVHFLNVDQGDSILIIAPSGESMLIDTSISKMDDVIIEYLRSVGVRKLDHLVLTHPDSDHIGSASKILNEIDTKAVYMPDITHTTKTFETLIETIDKLDIPLIIPNLNDKISLGGAILTVLAPVETSSDLNEMSLVLRLDYGEVSFLFTGDAGTKSEALMLKEHSASSLKAQVIKLGHHGSSSSSSKAFLLTVDPSFAIISCGKDNSYGHPHNEIVDLLKELQIQSYITYESGNVIFSTDGKKLNLIRPAS